MMAAPHHDEDDLQSPRAKRWVPDSEASKCSLCGVGFGRGLRSGKTHCRLCGLVFCAECCSRELLIPREAVVWPPAETLKSLHFDPLAPQKACQDCARDLQPLQRDLQAARRSNSVVDGPFYTVTLAVARGLCSVQRGPVSLAAVSLSVDGQIYNSAPARGPGTIAFNETFAFSVSGQLGNALRLRAYDESKLVVSELVGEGLIPLDETDADGTWVRLQKNGISTGQIQLKIAYSGPRVGLPSPASASISATHVPDHLSDVGSSAPSDMGSTAPYVSAPPTPMLAPSSNVIQAMEKSLDGEEDVAKPRKVWEFLGRNSWVMYAVILGLVVSYNLLAISKFGGETISMRPGMVIGNGKTVCSSTHCLKMRRQGDLVVTQSAPFDSRMEWTSGKLSSGGGDCPKCIAEVDSSGRLLLVKEGRSVLSSLEIERDSWLRQALHIKRPSSRSKY